MKKFTELLNSKGLRIETSLRSDRSRLPIMVLEILDENGNVCVVEDILKTPNEYGDTREGGYATWKMDKQEDLETTETMLWESFYKSINLSENSESAHYVDHLEILGAFVKVVVPRIGAVEADVVRNGEFK